MIPKDCVCVLCLFKFMLVSWFGLVWEIPPPGYVKTFNLNEFCGLFTEGGTVH